MQNTFDGKVAIVTGAGRGLGRAIALSLAAQGAHLLVADLDPDAAHEVAEQITAHGGPALATQVDVRDRDSVRKMVDRAGELGVLELAVNNAGIAGAPREVADYSGLEWAEVIDTNLTGVFSCLQAELAVMSAGRGGSIVNIASVLGLVGRRRAAAYVAAKHGVVGLTKSAALEYGDRGIRVNAVAPGFIITDLNRERLDESAQAAISDQTALGRLGQIDEITHAVTYLLSGQSSYVSGSCLVLDGGLSAQ